MFVKVQRKSFPYGRRTTHRRWERLKMYLTLLLNFQKDLTFFMESFIMNPVY